MQLQPDTSDTSVTTLRTCVKITASHLRLVCTKGAHCLAIRVLLASMAHTCDEHNTDGFDCFCR